MSDFNEDLSQSIAAELTGTTGMTEDGGNAPDDVLDAVAEQEQYEAEKTIPANNDVQDEAQYQLDREVEQEQTQQRGKKVPLAALHEERQKRQALELQLQAQAQQMQQLQAQWQAAQQAQQLAQQEPEVEFSEDPEQWLKNKEAQINARFEQLQNQQGQQPVPVQQLEAQVMQDAAVLGPAIADAELRFEAAHPDYQQAFDHVQRTADANMRAQHPGLSEQQLGMLRTAALVGFAKTCQAQGIDPAARIYESAQKLGFQRASQAPRREPPTSLSTVSGSSRAPDERGAITASQVSELSEKEFDDLWASMKRDSAVGPAF